MEKQTKILLGVGAVIAAYLILKPKKAQTDGNELNDNGNQIATRNMSKDEMDCNIEYAFSAKPQDMPSEETRALRQANFIERCMEQKEKIKYLIAEANRPDNVGGPAYMSPEELKILKYLQTS